MTVFNPETHSMLFMKSLDGVNNYKTFSDQVEGIWARDAFLSTLKDSGLVDVEISDTAPTDTNTVWANPNDPATDAPSAVKVYDVVSGSWKDATATLFSQLISRIGEQYKFRFETLDDLKSAEAAGEFQSMPDGYVAFANGLAYVRKMNNAHLTSLPNWVTPSASASIEHWGDVNQNNINEMESALGYVRFSTTVNVLENITISKNVSFSEGSSVSVSAGRTLTLLGSIDSTRQHIFKGSGNVVLGASGIIGQTARMVHVSWFGAITDVYDDQSPAMQKAYTAMGNLRESLIEYDIGSYHMHTTVQTTRGAWTKGSGERRTVFKIEGDGFVPFVTIGDACRFSELQFEHFTQLTTERNSPYIRIAHPDCEVKSVIAGRAHRSIEVASSNCQIDDVTGFYNVAGSAGSSLIAVKGSSHTIRNIHAVFASVGFAPEALVHVGAATGGSVSSTARIAVSGIESIMACIPVLIDGTDANVLTVNVSDINQDAIGSTSGVVIRNVDNTVSDIIINGVNVGATVSPAVLIEQNGTGQIADVSIDGLNANGSVGSGIVFTRTDGTLRQIRVGANVEVSERATPYQFNGIEENREIIINPQAIPNARTPVTFNLGSLDDDSSAFVDLRADLFVAEISVIAIQSGALFEFGKFAARVAQGPQIAEMSASANVEGVSGSVLTGVTGTDGKVTVSVNDNGVIYVENRMGAPVQCQLTILTGIN